MRFVATSADIVMFGKCIKQWGLGVQIHKLFEEMAELELELLKVWDNGSLDLDKVADEIADVYIMLHQVGYGFVINEAIDKRVEFKMERLAELLYV